MGLYLNFSKILLYGRTLWYFENILETVVNDFELTFYLALDKTFLLFFFQFNNFYLPFFSHRASTPGETRAANPPSGASTSAATHVVWIYVHNNVVIHSNVLIRYDF